MTTVSICSWTSPEYGRLLDLRYVTGGAELWSLTQLDELAQAVARFPTSRAMRARLVEISNVVAASVTADARHWLDVVEDSVLRSGDGAQATALVKLAEQRYGAGDHRAALEALGAAVQLHPTSPEAWSDFGVVQYSLGIAGCADSFDNAIRLKPGHVDALLNRSRWALATGLRSLAIQDAKRALLVDPSLDEARAVLTAAGPVGR